MSGERIPVGTGNPNRIPMGRTKADKRGYRKGQGTMGGVGERGMIQRGLQQMAKDAPERLAEILQTEEWQTYWLAAYKARLLSHERDAVRLYPELLKMVGPERNITIVLAERYGVSSEQELERLVNRVKEADQMTDDQRFERTCEFMRNYLRRNPEKMAYAKDYVLGGESYAEVVAEPSVLEELAEGAGPVGGV